MKKHNHVHNHITEKDFQTKVLHLAKQLGWLAYHTHDSRRSEPGFPDLVLVRKQVLFVELKTDTGKLTPAQSEWGRKLQAAGAYFSVWRPADWENIVKTLTKL